MVMPKPPETGIMTDSVSTRWKPAARSRSAAGSGMAGARIVTS